MIDLEQRFDRAWSGEPAPVPVAHRLAAAHRHQRRRRTTLAAGALCATVLLGGGAAVLPGLLAADPAPVSRVVGDQATRAATQEEVRTLLASPVERLPPGWGDPAAAYAPDGTIVVRPGWVVTEQIDDYLTRATDRTVALALVEDATGERQWIFLRLDRDEGPTVDRWGPPEALGESLAAEAAAAGATYREFVVPGQEPD